jgi:hypothetical protein
VQVAQGIAFLQRLAFELQASGGAHRTMRALSLDDVGTFEALERAVEILKYGRGARSRSA